MSGSRSLSVRQGGAGRAWGLEWILRPAVLAGAMMQNAVDDLRICNYGDDPQAGATDAKQRVYFENLLHQARPGAAGFPVAAAIILLRLGVWRGAGAYARCCWNRGSGPVTILAIIALTTASRDGDMSGNAMNPCQRIEGKHSGAGARVGRSGQGEVAVLARPQFLRSST